MKLYIITIGRPKLTYARLGWDEYYSRLAHYAKMQVTHIADSHNDAQTILSAAGSSYKIILMIEGKQLSSVQLAEFLEKRALDGRDISLIIGGPDGLPKEVIEASDFRWSLGPLTLPHDLAMVVTLETLYRAYTMNAGVPYHR